MTNRYPTTPKSATQTRRQGSNRMRSMFAFFDLAGTLVDFRGMVASMAARFGAMRVRGPVPSALDWAVRTAEALPAAQGPRFQSEQEIASDVLFNLLARRGRTGARDASVRLVRDAWAGYVGTCTLQPDITVAWLRTLRSQIAGLGVVTDGDTEAAAGALSPPGRNELFVSVTTSEAGRAYKPVARIYPPALKALQ